MRAVTGGLRAAGRQIGNLADGMDLRRDRVQEMSTLLSQLKQVAAAAACGQRLTLTRGWDPGDSDPGC